MSIAAILHYMDERMDLSKDDAFALACLADWADDKGECYPSIESIAKRLRMTTRRGGKAAIDRLAKRGELLVIEGEGMKTKSGSTNRYVLVSFRQKIGVPLPQGMNSASPVGVNSASSLDADGVNSSSRHGVNSASPVGVNSSSPKPVSINQSFNLSEDLGGETDTTREPAPPAPLTFFDGTPVEIDKSRIPTMTKRTSTRKATPFTPRWHKVLRGFRSVDMRKFDRDGMVKTGAGCTPIEVYCEFVPAQRLDDRTAEKIEKALADVAAEQIRAGFAEWVDRTKSKTADLDGMLDWAADPSKRYSSRDNQRGNSNGSNQKRQQPATTFVAEWQEQQRIGAPVRTLAELNRIAAEKYPEIEF